MNDSLFIDSACLRTAEKLLASARNCCFGLSFLIDDVLPQHMRMQSSEVKAEQFAAEVMFSLDEISSYSPAALQRARSWLSDTCFFLFEGCPPDDARLANVLMLIKKNREIRCDVFDELIPCSAPVCCDDSFPLPIEDLEKALSSLALLHDSKRRIRQFNKELENLCKQYQHPRPE